MGERMPVQEPTTLRQAICRHLGDVLTPTVGAAIEVEAAKFPDNSIDPTQFEPLVKAGLSFQAERMHMILGELHPLHQAHWMETEKHRHGLSLNPDYDALFADEKAGRLIQFTVRTEAQRDLVGNLRMYMGISRHTGTKFGQEDTLYLSPSARGGFAALTLMRFAERALLSLGVREIRADSKLINKADTLMRRMGYEPVSLQCVKIFKDQ